MKRDMDLVRRILIELSDSRETLSASAFVDDKVDFDTVCYHYQIMDDAGLIKASVMYAGDGYYSGIASSLTWDGNDFLSAIKSDTVWSKVKMRIAKTTGDASLDVIKALAVKIGTGLLMQGL
ncbi:MAG: DUF2513 domain-containing protein [Raoultibacter sp.]